METVDIVQFLLIGATFLWHVGHTKRICDTEKMQQLIRDQIDSVMRATYEREV